MRIKKKERSDWREQRRQYKGQYKMAKRNRRRVD